MRHFKKRILTFAAVIGILSAFAARADSALSGLWESGCAFLFDTDNVTVTGEAEFTLDGELFKTARLRYVQDGPASFYKLQLFTPAAGGSERETGWTILSDGDGNLAVMETYFPGVYRKGTSFAHNTLLRRSLELDALTDLGGFLVKQIGPMLPEGAVTEAETDEGKTVRIRLEDGEIPDVATSALNVAAGYLSDRWFSGGYDRNFED